MSAQAGVSQKRRGCAPGKGLSTDKLKVRAELLAARDEEYLGWYLPQLAKAAVARGAAKANQQRNLLYRDGVVGEQNFYQHRERLDMSKFTTWLVTWLDPIDAMGITAGKQSLVVPISGGVRAVNLGMLWDILGLELDEGEWERLLESTEVDDKQTFGWSAVVAFPRVVAELVVAPRREWQLQDKSGVTKQARTAAALREKLRSPGTIVWRLNRYSEERGALDLAEFMSERDMDSKENRAKWAGFKDALEPPDNKAWLATAPVKGDVLAGDAIPTGPAGTADFGDPRRLPALLALADVVLASRQALLAVAGTLGEDTHVHTNTWASYPRANPVNADSEDHADAVRFRGLWMQPDLGVRVRARPTLRPRCLAAPGTQPPRARARVPRGRPTYPRNPLSHPPQARDFYKSLKLSEQPHHGRGQRPELSQRTAGRGDPLLVRCATFSPFRVSYVGDNPATLNRWRDDPFQRADRERATANAADNVHTGTGGVGGAKPAKRVKTSTTYTRE
jgi:hypothetical protein